MKWYKIKYNTWIYDIILILLVIIIYNFIKYTISFKETFSSDNSNSSYKWSYDLIKKFHNYQSTMNNNKFQYNYDILQKQATSEEAQKLIQTGHWPWTDDLKQEYINQVWSDTILKINPEYALNYAMGIYNQNAITKLLAWNTKEGKFILYGATNKFGDKFQCSNDLHSRIMKNNKLIDPANLPKEIPGFTFIKNTCDPCIAINNPSEFTCPFKLNIEGDTNTSIPWKRLWNLYTNKN